MATGDNATRDAIRGQKFEFSDFIDLNTTANPVAAGNLTLAISRDFGAVAANQSGTAVVAISGMTGAIYITIGALDMDANVITYTVTSDTANSVVAKGEIKTLTLTESGTRAPLQTVIRSEQFFRQMWSRLFNRNTIGRTAGAYSVYDDADSTILYAGTSSDDGQTGTMGKLS